MAELEFIFLSPSVLLYNLNHTISYQNVKYFTTKDTKAKHRSQSTINQAYACVLCECFKSLPEKSGQVVVKFFTTKRGRTTEATKNFCPANYF